MAKENGGWRSQPRSEENIGLENWNDTRYEFRIHVPEIIFLIPKLKKWLQNLHFLIHHTDRASGCSEKGYKLHLQLC